MDNQQTDPVWHGMPTEWFAGKTSEVSNQSASRSAVLCLTVINHCSAAMPQLIPARHSAGLLFFCSLFAAVVCRSRDTHTMHGPCHDGGAAQVWWP